MTIAAVTVALNITYEGLLLTVKLFITPRRILPEFGGGCVARFPKPLPLIWPKSLIFPTLFMTRPKLQYLFMTAVTHTGLSYIQSYDNDEKSISFRKHTQF